jgi:hypothetical protein
MAVGRGDPSLSIVAGDQSAPNAGSALEDCQVQMSRTAPISAIPVRSIHLTNGGLLVQTATSRVRVADLGKCAAAAVQLCLLADQQLLAM